MEGETTNICLQILNGDLDIRPINRTLISLIPKVSSPKKVQDFRSISLCHVIYKIIVKSIANRMKKVLDSIISQFQAAFVSGRQISDNVLVGFECIHAINNKSKGKEG